MGSRASGAPERLGGFPERVGLGTTNVAEHPCVEAGELTSLLGSRRPGFEDAYHPQHRRATGVADPDVTLRSHESGDSD
jgi:hypothetical protein